MSMRNPRSTSRLRSCAATLGGRRPVRQSDQNGWWQITGGLSFDPPPRTELPHCTTKAGDGQQVPQAGCHPAVLGKCGSQRANSDHFCAPAVSNCCAARGPVELRALRLC